jgi:hypothetical protein
MNPIARFLSVAFSAAFLSPFAFAADFTVNPAIGQVFADVLSAPTTFTTGLRYEVLTTAPNNAFKVEDGQAKKDGQPVNPSTLSPLEKGTVALTYKPADAGEMPNLSYALSSHFSRITVPNIVSLRYTVTEGSATTTYESFYDVTAIADAAFKADQGSGILSISFTAGNSISSIGKDAFRGVNNLNSITWTTLTNLTTISPNAFKGCRSLITQSDGDLEKLTKLISLGDSAFAETILSSVTLAAASLQSLGKHAFADIPTLTTVTLSDCHALSPAFLTKDVFGSNLTGIVFPNTYIASIPDAAFQGCGNLSSVTFPKRVTRIGNSAFANCPLLTTLAWPDGRTVPAVEVIGNSAFKNTALTALDFTKEANGGFFPGIKYIEAEAFAGVSAPLTLPSTILSVGQAAFDAVTIANLSQLLQGSPLLEGINKKMFGSTPSTKLTTITLPTWLTFIEEAAFQGCTNLQTVNWINLANLKEIRKNAFKETAVGKDGKLLGTETGLPKLTALESIEESAFSAVAIPVGNLTPLTLPQSLQYLGPNAFANNQGLTSVNLSTNTNLKTLTPYHSSITSTDKPLVTLNSAMFGRWLSSISFPSNLTAIADNAFKDAAALTTLANFSSLNNLLSIGAAAFEATQVGPSLSWPSTPSITSIAPRAFYNAAISTTTADYFTLPSTLTSLGDSAFAANPALTKLSLENNNTPPLLTLFENKLINSTPPPPLHLRPLVRLRHHPLHLPLLPILHRRQRLERTPQTDRTHPPLRPRPHHQLRLL